jgi:hypothetical protein
MRDRDQNAMGPVEHEQAPKPWQSGMRDHDQNAASPAEHEQAPKSPAEQ